MTRLLVTGGSGFIGSHTCLLLLEKGYELIILDSLINSSKFSIERISEIAINKNKKNSILFVKGDIRDAELIDNIFKNAEKSNKQIDGVIHFAGLKSVRDSVANPKKYWDTNVKGSQILFAIMEKYGCKTIVFSSSASVYDKTETNKLLTENSRIKPLNPYGETKLAIEKILENLYKNSNLNWRIAILRYFNPIGAHPSGKIGEDPSGSPNNLFPIITKVALKK